MESLKQAFCRTHACSLENFERKAFLAALYPHARVLTWFGGAQAECFVADRALIGYCGRLCSIQEIDSELREYATHPENRRFVRRVLRLRVSGRRLKRLAAACLGAK
jgi:hypothetical protein